MRSALLAIGILACASGAAAADDRGPALEPVRGPRPLRWSVGGGGILPLTGSMGASLLGELEVLPGGRWGRLGVVGRAQVGDEGERGVATLGVIYEAAAARPRLWLELHADVGVTWGDVHPVAGAGVITHLTIWGPLGIALDTGAHLTYDGIDTELMIGSGLLVVIAR